MIRVGGMAAGAGLGKVEAERIKRTEPGVGSDGSSCTRERSPGWRRGIRTGRTTERDQSRPDGPKVKGGSGVRKAARTSAS
jgi:hypothetical protein